MHTAVTPQTAPTVPHAPPAGVGRTRITQRLALVSQLAFATLVLGLFLGGRTHIAVGFVPQPWDKLLHAAVFATVVILMAASHPRWGWHVPPHHVRHRQSHRMWLLLCMLAASTLGTADELHQLFLPGRSADLDDWAADTVGAILGAFAWARFVRYINR